MRRINIKLNEKGQSLTELALSITVVLILLAGSFDLGSAYFCSIAMRDAAQEGAVYGSINPTDIDGIQNRVLESSSRPIDFLNDPNVHQPEVSVSGDSCAGGAITVSLTYDYQITMPFIGAILNSQTIPIHTEVTNTILNPACDE